ncbi:MAG: RHS repeat-associated core domain-containing protein, partial [Pseudomonadota bacterium]
MNRHSTQYQSTNPLQAQSDVYRYGFNGKEMDGGIKSSDYDFGARKFSTLLGRWYSVDRLACEYNDLSPYSFAGNTPISAYDPDGRLIIF